MCGIIGYVGTKDALPVLLGGLKKLEYRGYDSSGVGLLGHEGLVVRKAKGKIRNLEELIRNQAVPYATVGISHTRWATHGLPSDINSHPHTDNKHHIAVVHNGIIENYVELRDMLKAKGCAFVSQTDTEVIAHLVSTLYKGDIIEAARKAVLKLKGAFALGIICQDNPDVLFAARIGSPLVIGCGDQENFIASDVPAILDRTRRVIYLKDGQMAVITKDKVELSDFNGKKAAAKIDTVDFSIDVAQKDGYAHFMLKEIHQQPDVMQSMLNLRLGKVSKRATGKTAGSGGIESKKAGSKSSVGVQNKSGSGAHNQSAVGAQSAMAGGLNLEGLDVSDAYLASVRKITIIACGTAYHAGLAAKYAIEQMAGISVEVDTSSEFRYRGPIIDKHTLIIAISQSGETADTLAAAREAKARGAKVVAVCNVIGSSLARESHGVLYTHAGPEIGVASTKAYTAQLMMLYFIAIKLGLVRRTLTSKDAARMTKTLAKIPSLFKHILAKKHAIQKVAEANSHFGCFLFLGRNINYPSAMEGALKLKEISYIPAEGYAAGEMKHGPIALIDEYRAVVCIAPQSHVYEKMASNIQEIRARKGNIIAVVTEGDKDIAAYADYVLEVPAIDEIFSPLLVVLPLQLLAYFVAVKRGCDVDQPRNLAKSVTVE